MVTQSYIAKSRQQAEQQYRRDTPIFLFVYHVSVEERTDIYLRITYKSH